MVMVKESSTSWQALSTASEKRLKNIKLDFIFNHRKVLIVARTGFRFEFNVTKYNSAYKI